MEIVFAVEPRRTPKVCKKVGNHIEPIVLFVKPKEAAQKDFDAAVGFLIAQAEKTMKKPK